MARIGYARVSSTDQDVSIQLERLKSERRDVIVESRVRRRRLVPVAIEGAGRVGLHQGSRPNPG